MSFSTKKYVIEQDFPLSREIVWNLLSDTDRLNRIIGLFSVQFGSAKKSKGTIFYRDAIAKVAGIVPVHWKEYPFQWEKYENYMVEREYDGGPLKHFIGGIELLDSDIKQPNGLSGTRVRLIGEFTPRNIIGVAAIPVTGLKSMKNTLKYIEDYLKVENSDEKIRPQQKLTQKVNLQELERLKNKLLDMPVDPNYVSYLLKLLAEGDSNDLAKMRPIQIAREWGANQKEVIRLFLYATKAGLLNLSWNLICPNCRVSKVEYKSLSNLEELFHCDLCGINYNANFGQYVELNFSVHPSIRFAFDPTYCVGGPMITPHISVQKVIKSGESIKLTLPSLFEQMRIRILQANRIVTLKNNPKKCDEPISIKYSDEGWSEPSLFVNSERAFITIDNSNSEDVIIVLEKTEWSNEVITAAMVTSMQEFRDLFSSEVLSPGQQVGIENVTILFSDLQASTSLYETVGDANAYGQVRRHFDFLTKWISTNSGGVVKTIGDAVMAVFHLPEDGINAAIQIQKHVEEFNKNGKDHIILKIGLYSGPAIAVNSNDRLDYFGRTVNIAARIQGQSIGNDIVISKNYLEDDNILSIVTDPGLVLLPFQAKLKGIDENIDLIRINIK